MRNKYKKMWETLVVQLSLRTASVENLNKDIPKELLPGVGGSYQSTLQFMAEIEALYDKAEDYNNAAKTAKAVNTPDTQRGSDSSAQGDTQESNGLEESCQSGGPEAN